MRHTIRFVILIVLAAAPWRVTAQGTLADYQRAAGLARRYQGKSLNVVDPVGWKALEDEGKTTAQTR
jgi:hypothetical protein